MQFIHRSKLALALVALAVPSALASQALPDLKARLARLETRLEAERVKLHIPGLAIAVVHEDRVLFSRGFGLRDVEAKKPVTPETIFAVGSTTKAFTSTLIGMLKDDGVLDWDDAVAKHIPSFRLDVDTGEQVITLRDLLCHRTGFTRMGALWAAGTLTRDEILAHAARAKPWGKFREQFLYNNVMYMAAGHAGGLAAGSSWAELIETRIFKPLGMHSSSTSIRVARRDARIAKGYRWDADKGAFTHLPMRKLDVVGPAGSINSNVLDMAQWIRFQLGRGDFDGRRLLAASTHRDTWRRQIAMSGATQCALGWMLQTWKRNRVVEHGGSIDGFAAQVSLLPRKKLGYVLLCNVTATPLQQKSIDIVFDSLLSAKPADIAVRPDDKSLVGEYIANFASFRDASFRAVWKNGRLALDVPGQQVFELKAPQKDGKRYFALTDMIAVSFQRDDAGAPVSLTMYQNGMEFEAPRKGVERALQMPLADMEALTGRYRDEKTGRHLELLVHRKRLYVQEEKGGRFELAAPTKERATWAMRANPKRLQLRFERRGGKGGAEVIALTRIQRKGEVRMPRVEGAGDAKLPKVSELRALLEKGYGAAKLGELGALRLHGTTRFVHQGARGSSSLLLSGARMRSKSELGKVGSMHVAFDGERGWQRSSFAPFVELSGRALKQLAQKHPLWFLHQLNDVIRHASIASIAGRGNVDGEATIIVRVELPDMPRHTLAISAKRGLVLMEKTTQILPGVTSFPVTYRHSDFRMLRGVMLPFRSVARTVQMRDVETRYERADFVDALPSDAFRMEKGAGR